MTTILYCENMSKNLRKNSPEYVAVYLHIEHDEKIEFGRK